MNRADLSAAGGIYILHRRGRRLEKGLENALENAFGNKNPERTLSPN